MTTWGEKPGLAIGCVVDAAPGLSLANLVQGDRLAAARNVGQARTPGDGWGSAPSGCMRGITDAIAMMIDNVDARSGDYPRRSHRRARRFHL